MYARHVSMTMAFYSFAFYLCIMYTCVDFARWVARWMEFKLVIKDFRVEMVVLFLDSGSFRMMIQGKEASKCDKYLILY